MVENYSVTTKKSIIQKFTITLVERVDSNYNLATGMRHISDETIKGIYEKPNREQHCNI